MTPNGSSSSTIKWTARKVPATALRRADRPEQRNPPCKTQQVCPKAKLLTATCSAATEGHRLPVLSGSIGESPAATSLAPPGQRIRIRIINSAADTAFRIAPAGHSMIITHTDGYPVIHSEVAYG